jgi:hypothetical protein
MRVRLHAGTMQDEAKITLVPKTGPMSRVAAFTLSRLSSAGMSYRTDRMCSHSASWVTTDSPIAKRG